MMSAYLVYLKLYSKRLYEQSIHEKHTELTAIARMLSIEGSESPDGLCYQLRSPDFCQITGFIQQDRR